MNETPIFASVEHDLQLSYDELIGDGSSTTTTPAAAQAAPSAKAKSSPAAD